MNRRVLIISLLTAAVAVAGGFTIIGSPVNFTDCSSGGSTAQALTTGPNLMRANTTEPVWVCLSSDAGACAAGGDFYPPGFAGIINLGSNQSTASCRSAASTGDIVFTPVAY